MTTEPPNVTDGKALENFYRLNMGGEHISSDNDTGMYRSWDPDDIYIYGAASGSTPFSPITITYTSETPSYTAPELVYQSQRSMGNQSDTYNLTWRLPVDSGFFYSLRLHFCNIIPQYTRTGQVVFTIFINNQTADKEIDLFDLTPDSGYPVYKDYVVFVHDPDGSMLCGRPAINLGLPDEQVNLAELGKSCYQKGTLHDIIDQNLSGEIAPKCLMKFGEVVYSCLEKEGIARPAMDEVVWGLEFALQLQENTEKTGGMVDEAVLENQQLSFSMQAEPATTDEYVLLGTVLENQQLSFSMQAEPATTDEYVLLGSTREAIKHDTQTSNL
ncbi:hypothetical protein L1987_44040 [Smallanthus sonchifolius]|uniref:Uncharacterized protein n=1 Tax=Smallanthus sonchifolius TaxID=185202 RepID=A0ACB9GQD3_9ASTR|nr:hypothetical protein L1987_44040 [Smallanthus sonchifolius]